MHTHVFSKLLQEVQAHKNINTLVLVVRYGDKFDATWKQTMQYFGELFKPQEILVWFLHIWTIKNQKTQKIQKLIIAISMSRSQLLQEDV